MSSNVKGNGKGTKDVKGTFQVKRGLAEMLKGGVIMDVMNAEQAEIAQEAGACAVMALERIPSQIRKNGGVARMSDPSMIKRIQAVVDIPVMAKCRIGHLVEAQILEALEVDFIDESEVLTPRTRRITSGSTTSRRHSCAAAAIWARPCAASAKARR